MKSILVIGGSGGIGKAITRRLADEYNIIIFDKNEADLSRVNVSYIAGDVRNEDDLEALEYKIQLLDEFYGIVFASGIMIPGSITEISNADWAETIEVNLTSVYKICRLLMPYLLKQKHSHVISIASHIGVVGAYNLSAYCASKAALIELMKCISLDFSDQGLCANTISPGFIETDLLKNAISKFATSKKWMFATGGLPKQRVSADDVAKVAAMLLDQDSINGENIVIDAGYTSR